MSQPLRDDYTSATETSLQLSINGALMRRLDALDAQVKRLTKKVADLEGRESI